MNLLWRDKIKFQQTCRFYNSNCKRWWIEIFSRWVPQIMNAPVDIGIVSFIIILQSFDHSSWLLGSCSIVQIYKLQAIYLLQISPSYHSMQHKILRHQLHCNPTSTKYTFSPSTSNTTFFKSRPTHSKCLLREYQVLPLSLLMALKIIVLC